MKKVLLVVIFLISQTLFAESDRAKQEIHAFGFFNLTNKAEIDTIDPDLATVSVNTELKSPGVGAGAEYIFHLKEVQSNDKTFNFFLAGGIMFDNKREVDSCTFVISGSNVACDPADAKLQMSSLHIHALFEINPFIRVFAGPSYNQPDFSSKSEYLYSLDGSFGYNVGLSFSYDNFRLQAIYKNQEGDARIAGSDIDASGDYNYSSFLVSFGIYFNHLAN